MKNIFYKWNEKREAIADRWPLPPWLFLFMLLIGCREEYDARHPSPPTGYLVVEGFINGGTGPTVIHLSRTRQLSDAGTPLAEGGAKVFVESSTNERFALAETAPGTYSLPGLTLDGSKNYRLFIQAKGKDYASAYTGMQKTPAIDSISWQRQSGGVQFYVHTSDPTNKARYYQWKFEETWEVNSTYSSTLTYDVVNQQVRGVKYRHPDRSAETAFLRCWPQSRSTGLLLGSTEKQVEDIVHLPLHYIPPQNEKLSVLYSIEVKQYKLSAKAYEFLLQMKKNTEQLGSIFDPQPSEMAGNIQCLTNPSEVVVGFVEVAEEKTARIFVSNREVSPWAYLSGCESTVIVNHPDSIAKYGLQVMPTLVFQDDDWGNITHFSAAPPRCVDCRLGGGTNVKPSFWP